MYINFIKRATVREAQSCICNMIFMQFSSKSEKQAFSNNRILLIYNVIVQSLKYCLVHTMQPINIR